MAKRHAVSGNDVNFDDDLDFSGGDVTFDETPEVASDPFAGVQYTGDVETDAKKEISALLAGFQQRAAAEEKRRRQATDSEFWFCVCFPTREEKDAFLRAIDMFEHGDKYLDGMKLAKKLGIDNLPASGVTFPDPRIDPKFAALARDMGKGGE